MHPVLLFLCLGFVLGGFRIAPGVGCMATLTLVPLLTTLSGTAACNPLMDIIYRIKEYVWHCYRKPTAIPEGPFGCGGTIRYRSLSCRCVFLPCLVASSERDRSLPVIKIFLTFTPDPWVLFCSGRLWQRNPELLRGIEIKLED